MIKYEFSDIKPGDLFKRELTDVSFFNIKRTAGGYYMFSTYPDYKSKSHLIVIIETSLKSNIWAEGNIEKDRIVFYAFDDNALYGSQHKYFYDFEKISGKMNQ